MSIKNKLTQKADNMLDLEACRKELSEHTSRIKELHDIVSLQHH